MLRILLDTNVLLWSLDQEKRISPSARTELADPDNQVFFSAVCIWEIAVKYALGKPDSVNKPERMLEVARTLGFEKLGVEADLACKVGSLPLHHHDPFDRLIVAQALSLPTRLYTSDRRLCAPTPN